MGIKFERVKDVFSICSDKIKVEFSKPQIQAHDDYGYCKNENGILYYYYDVDIYTKLNKKWKKMLEIDTYDFPNLINFKKILDLFISRDIDVNNYQKNFYNDGVICSTYNLETNGLGEDFYSVTCQYLENDGVKEKEYYNVTIGKSLFIDSSEVLGVTFNNLSYEELKTIYECVNGFIQYSIDNKNKIIIESNKKEISAWKIQGSKLYKLKEDNSIEEIYIKGDKIEDAIVLHGDIDSKDFYSSKICDFVIDDIKEDYIFLSSGYEDNRGKYNRKIEIPTKIDIKRLIYIFNDVDDIKLSYNEKDIGIDFLYLLSDIEKEEFKNKDIDFLYNKWKEAILNRTWMCRKEHNLPKRVEDKGHHENVYASIRVIIKNIKDILNDENFSNHEKVLKNLNIIG